ncbi:MAG: carbohydrate-binding protein [Hungatella sp.]|nr:carbohydrate-binding protein [Hungatella sp.]
MSRFKRKPITAAFLAVIILLSSMMPAAPAFAASGTPLKPHVNIGYWLGGNGGSNKTLAQASPGWDVINVSFIETKGNYYTPSLSMDLSAVYSGSEAQQIAAFKADIQTLKAQGKKVVISCGGQNGVVHLDNASQRDTFLNGVKAIIDEYDFDGFDVDFEGSSISCMNTDRIGSLITQQSINLEYILRNLKSTYGSDFIISAAPEYYYVQGGAISTGNSGAFLPVLDACRDILTYIHPQYYNGYNADFTWLQPSANAGPPFSQVYSAEGYIRLSEMLITGFVTMDKGTFVGLRPDQVAFGVPARNGAGNGAQSVSVYASALNTLFAQYPTYRGIMTWSIGWDESGGNSFVNTIAPIITAANNLLPSADAQTPIITSQPSDQAVSLDGTAVLTVAAAVSKGTLSYQWYQVSGKVNTGGTAVNGATSSAYNAPTGIEGTNYYYCLVTNTDNSAAGNKTATAASNAVTVSVTGNQLPDGDTWEADVVYTAGQTVVYQGQTYLCKWWTKGDIPSAGGPWELQNGSNEYVHGKAYTGGDIVVYQGQTWRANWWTTAVPGTDSSWSLV